MTSDGGLLQTQFIRYFKSGTIIYNVWKRIEKKGGDIQLQIILTADLMLLVPLLNICDIINPMHSNDLNH